MSDELRECVVCGCTHLSDEIEALQAKGERLEEENEIRETNNATLLRDVERLQAKAERLKADLDTYMEIANDKVNEVERLQEVLWWFSKQPLNAEVAKRALENNDE